MSRLKAILGPLAATLLLAATTAAATTAVAATDDADAVGLTGIDWTLVSITLDGASTEVPSDVGASLLLEDGQATGSSGCNQFISSYVTDGDLLSFGPIATTRMLCEGPGGDVESAYLAVLPSVAYWALAEDGRLVLSDGSGAELLAYTAGAGGIEGVTWLLREQAIDDAMGAVPPEVTVSLLLERGVAGGTGGCNRYFADYEIDGDSITFGVIGSTMMACPEPQSSIEATYLANLGDASTWASDGATLSFADAGGATLLVYEAAPAATIEGDWVAQGINDGAGGVVTTESTPLTTAVFGADGRLTGFDGCNDYFADYAVDGESVAIGPVATTRMACPSEELASQAASYAAALAASRTWSVTDDGILELQDEGGALQVAYLPAGEKSVSARA